VNDQFRYIINLTPEATFQNNITHKETWWKTWEKLADSNEFAKTLINKYQKRPSRELYDVNKDPYNMENLADDPNYENIVISLDKVLKDWMIECGDEGQKTEMKAKEHMFRFRKKSNQD
jgi:uncharacterized sulfatase